MDKDVQKRIEELEARVAKLEKLFESGEKPNGNVGIKRMLDIDVRSHERDKDGKRMDDVWGNRIFVCILIDTENNVYSYRSNCIGTWGLTIRDFRTLADSFGVEIDQKMKTPQIVSELIKRFGKNGTMVKNNVALDINHNTSIYKLSDADSELTKCVAFLSDKELIEREFKNEPFKLDPKWSKAELAEAIMDYVNTLVKKYSD